MDRARIIQSLHRHIAEQMLEGEAEHLTPTTPLLEVANIDSFSWLSLLTLIESEFDAEIDADGITRDQIKDIESIAQLVQDTLARQGAR